MQTSNKIPHRFVCSVIVPVRNNLLSQLRLVQWIDNPACDLLEIIVVQDCVNSREGAQIRSLLEAKNSRNLVYFESDFGNPGSARNFGLSRSTSDWVAFWDADDIPHVERFLEVLHEARENEAEILIGSYQVRYDAENSAPVSNFDKLPKTVFDQIVLHPGLWRFAFKRSLLNQARFPASSMGEDQAFISSVAIFDRKIFRSSKVVYDYFTGEFGHLTNNQKLMGDMKISLKFLNQTRKNQESDSKRLTEFLIVKQILTSLKRGNLPLRIWAAATLFRAFSVSPISSSQALKLFFFRRGK
jgi:glycosyltransferase involved in cell wall biosynthesis